MRVRRLPLLLTLALLVACTSRGSSPATTIATSGTLPTPSAQTLSCDKASISQAVVAFLHAWNAGDMASLHSGITRDASINIPTMVQGASGSKADAYTEATGWKQIRRFALRQHAVGQRFSFDALRLVSGLGAYAVGMRATYADGSTQKMIDSKFAYTCGAAALHRVVLVASTPAS
jgi:hypothetical protein